MIYHPGESLAGEAANGAGAVADQRGDRRLQRIGMRYLIPVAVAFAVVGVSPAVAQLSAREHPAPQSPVHLVVFNRPGPNFAKLADLRGAALQHRDTYLRWADSGEIIASGSLEGEPELGITVFRRGADEQSIRRTLNRDPLVAAGILDIEFRHWSLQMGALPDPSGGRVTRDRIGPRRDGLLPTPECGPNAGRSLPGDPRHASACLTCVRS